MYFIKEAKHDVKNDNDLKNRMMSCDDVNNSKKKRRNRRDKEKKKHQKVLPRSTFSLRECMPR